MAMKHISDVQVLRAVVESKKMRECGHKVWPYELLEQWTGQCEKVCLMCMERAVERGYLDYGVSLRTAWLTEEGKNMNEKQEGIRKKVDSLSCLDELPRQERAAFIAWFSGGSSVVMKVHSAEDPGVFFGKAECEMVDFDDIWLGKFPSLGWIVVSVEETGIAKGVIGQPSFTKYKISATEKGLKVVEAYRERLKN